MRWIGQITYDEVAYFREDVIIEAGNKLGIGTTSPEYTLDVAGIINTNSNYRQGGVKILSRESSNTVLEANGANSLIFETNNNEAVRITETGKVGIGTTSPGEKVDVAGNIKLNGNGNQLRDYNGNNIISNASNTLTIGSGAINTTHVRGNVGIGTASPASALHVVGTVQVGVDDTGHDVIFYGATSGKKMQWDESADTLIVDGSLDINGSSNISGEAFFTNSIDVTSSGHSTRFRDGHKVHFNTARTASIYTSSDDLYIENGVDDKDIIFRCDDGSGGVAEYFRLDGSSTEIRVSKQTQLSDNVKLALGNGEDLQIFHDGSNSYIAQQAVGDLYIQQNTADKDLVLQCDDGSGGTATYLTLDGSAGYTTAQKQIRFADSVEAQFGGVADLTIAHDATNSIVANNTGDLQIKNRADDKDIIFESDDGSGGTTAYLTLDGSAGTIEIAKAANFANNVTIQGSGDSADGLHLKDRTFVAFSDAGSVVSRFRSSAAGVFQLQDGSYNTGITLKTNATSTFTGGGITVGVDDTGHDVKFFGATSGRLVHWDESANKLYLTDSTELRLGTGGDVAIFHDGSNTYLENKTGSLIIRQQVDDDDIIFKCDDGSGGETAYLTLDGSTNAVTFHKLLEIKDNVKASFGNGGDLQIYHDGSNSYITQSGTGHLQIRQTQDDKDIIFECDDGSGGTEEYFRLDGSAGGANPVTIFPDNSYIHLGSGQDMVLGHTGSDTYITNNTGDLYIQNKADDKDIIFQSDDGSGGVTTYFQLDGGEGRTVFKQNALWEDSKAIYMGNGADLRLYHNGSNSFIESHTGNLTIDSAANDADIIFKGTDGSADITALTLDMSDAGTAIFNHDIKIADDGILKIGNSTDLYLSHDATNSHIANATGDLKITQNANDKDIIFNCDDGSGGNTAYLTLDGSAGNMKAATNMRFSDSKQLQLGDSGDLSLQHDGSASYISNAVGNVFITQNANDGDIFFKSDDGSGGTAIYLALDGGVGYTIASKVIRFNDSISSFYGSGSDAAVQHDGSNFFISNTAGNFTIRQRTNDGDLILQCDDGSGGDTAYLTLDGGEGHTIANKEIQFLDSVVARFGTGNDFKIHHDGTNTLLVNNTGSLFIDNYADDADTYFRNDNGAGGIATYFFLDGSLATHDGSATTALSTVWPDNSKVVVGAGTDGRFWHNGSSTFIQNLTGDLEIQNYSDDKDIIFKNDDGSGGITAYLTLDGSQAQIIFNKNAQFQDNVRLKVGSGGDIQIKHDGSNSSISNATGNLTLSNSANDSDIILKCDDGSGGTTPYLTLDGSSTNMKAHKNFYVVDDILLGIGSGFDMRLYHDGSNSFLRNDTGNLTIFNNTNDGDIIFQSDDGSGGTETYITIDGGARATIFSNSTLLVDGKYAYFGTGYDFNIRHTGSNAEITNTVGNLTIKNQTNDGDIIFQSDDGSGGVQTYLTIDGGLEVVTVPDTIYLGAGTSFDLSLRHDGSNSHIQNNTGDLTIKNTANDKDIIFQSDDGSGGVETYFFLDGSLSGGNPCTVFPDNSNLQLGTAGDLSMTHNGSNSFINNATGDLTISVNGTDKDLILKSDNGSGGETPYLTLDGSTKTLIASVPLVVNADLSVNADSVTFTSDSANDPLVTIKNTDDSAGNTEARLRLLNQRGTTAGAGQDGDTLGSIDFKGFNDAGTPEEIQYGTIKCFIDDATNGQESGLLKLGIASHDGSNDYGLKLTGGSQSNEVDAYVGLGTSSVTTIAGNILINGADLNFANVPTSDPEIAGSVWSDSGRLMISAG